MAQTGVVIGPHPLAKYYRQCQSRATLVAEAGGEAEAARLLEAMGCTEVILFACPFSHIKDEVSQMRVRNIFMEMEIPVYQTLYATPIRLPVVDIQEFM